MRTHSSAAVLIILLLLASGCAGVGGAPPGGPQPTQTGGSQPAPHPLDAQQAERIRRIMAPLVSAMDHPRPLSQIKVGVMDDPHVNAASAGGGEFYVTTGLLQKATDEHLRGVLAHELAHDDLGHVAKAQALGAGVGIGMIILDQIFPGSGRITPVAGALITSGYSRAEEYAADRHGVDILARWIFEEHHDQCADVALTDRRSQRRRNARDSSGDARTNRRAEKALKGAATLDSA
jgi:predicted Zn-dependent protease